MESLRPIVIRSIHRIEQEFDVNSLRCGELLVWPLIRMALWRQLSRPDLRIIKPKPVALGREPSVKPFSAESFEPYLCTEEELALAGIECDAVFASRPEEYGDVLRGRALNRFIDPLMAVAGKRFICVKLEVAAPPAPVRELAQPSLFLDEREFTDRKRELESERGVERITNIQNFEAFQACLSDILPDLDAPESHFLTVLREFDDQQAFFVRTLSLLRPKVLFLVCYYLERSMALVRACRMLGTTAVDLQHGTQERFHIGYDRWLSSPPGGYDVFPEAFWVWGRKTAKDLAERFSPHVTPPRVIVGGYPWMNQALRAQDDTAELRESFRRYRRIALVTWTSLPGELPDALVDAMRKSPHDWLWLFRLHPLSRRSVPEQIEEFKRMGVRNVDVQTATETPLYSLLRHATHHMTRSSTVGYEALRFGVPSAVVHPDGLDIYADYIQQGIVAAPQSSDEILAFVEREPSEFALNEPLPYFEMDEAATDRALRSLLDR